MDDLVQWLGEQLDEDERIARAATPGPWHAQDGGVVSDDDEQWPVEASESDRDREDRVHIAAHDPARVLREIDAKRQLLALHEPSRDIGADSDENDPSTFVVCCGTCQVGVVHPGDWPCETLRLLALPDVDRPGFREEWRP